MDESKTFAEYNDNYIPLDETKCNISKKKMESVTQNTPPQPVLYFDAYGNLATLAEFPKTALPSVPSLEEFDSVLENFSENLTESKRVTISPRRISNGKLSSRKTKLKLDNSVSDQSFYSDEDLKQAFKSEIQNIVTTRYGRRRKIKSEEDFLFGTLNFKELKKITAGSPKKVKCINLNSVPGTEILKCFSDQEREADGTESPLLDPKQYVYSSDDDFEPDSKRRKKEKSVEYVKKKIRSSKSPTRGIQEDSEVEDSKPEHDSFSTVEGVQVNTNEQPAVTPQSAGQTAKTQIHSGTISLGWFSAGSSPNEKSRLNKEDRVAGSQVSGACDFIGFPEDAVTNPAAGNNRRLAKSEENALSGTALYTNSSVSKDESALNSAALETEIPSHYELKGREPTNVKIFVSRTVPQTIKERVMGSSGNLACYSGPVESSLKVREMEGGVPVERKSVQGKSVISEDVKEGKGGLGIHIKHASNRVSRLSIHRKSKSDNKGTGRKVGIKCEDATSNSPKSPQNKATRSVQNIENNRFGSPPAEEHSATKSGRAIRKTHLIDLSEELRRQKEAQKKLAEAAAAKDSLSPSDRAEVEKEQAASCDFQLGDVVWAGFTRCPLWPAMVTSSETEKQYTKLAGTGNIQKPQRLYHVLFFCDKSRTSWIKSSQIYPFLGIDNLRMAVEHAKEKCDEKVKFTVTQYNKKSNCLKKIVNWRAAIREAERALSLDRSRRMKKYKTGCASLPVNESDGEANDKVHECKSDKKPSSSGKVVENNNNISDKQNTDVSDEILLEENEFSSESRLEDKLKVKNEELRVLRKGSFQVYCQKRLYSFMHKNKELSKDAAIKALRKAWNQLSVLQKSKYFVTDREKRKRSITSRKSVSSSDTENSNSAEMPSFFLQKGKGQIGTSDAGELIEVVPGRGTYKVLSKEKVCGKCEVISLKGGQDMIKCKGVCFSVFHLECVGLKAHEENYRCEDCRIGKHTCFCCKSFEGEMIKCSVHSCGKFYHDLCIRKWPQVSKYRGSEKLVCPRHVCHMCAANADDMNDPSARTPPFTRCLRCPTTYHTGDGCIAAGSEEVSFYSHVCTRHLVLKNPKQYHVNVNWCFCCSKGGSLVLCDECPAAVHADCMNIVAPEGGYICEDCENGKCPCYRDIVWVKIGQFRWWPAQVLHPKFIPDNIERLKHQQGMFCVHFFGSNDYYWVTKGRTFQYQEGDEGGRSSGSKSIEKQFQTALEQAAKAFAVYKQLKDQQEAYRTSRSNVKPPPYVRIDINRPVGNVRSIKPDVSSISKCDCDPNSENPCGSDDKCLNRMLLTECLPEVCAAKDLCQNQRFQRKHYPNVHPFKTSARGWGLKTEDPIKKGDFVIEYVGELIDEAELRRRIEEMHDKHEENYYFLTIDKDRIIDAGPKGNLARFMNHSCQPNCETQKWNVGGETRVGLFALHSIEAGSELTFNYNLECVGTEKKKCSCGALMCSGYIGAKVKTEVVKKENGEKKKKKRKRREQKSTENECFRCAGHGDLVLCDMTMCPKGYHLECLGLDALPKGKWSCPWHFCDDCGSKASSKCILCPNSYCRFHSAGKFHSTPGLGNVCLEHSSEAIHEGGASDEITSTGTTSSEEGVTFSEGETPEAPCPASLEEP